MKNEHIYPLRIHIEDTDFGGVVYHSNYLNFMERARSEWMDELGLGIEWQREHGVYFVVHAINIEYIKPGRLHEKVEVVSTIKDMRKTSIVFEQSLRLASSPDKMLTKAEVRIVSVGQNMRPCAIPEVSDANFILRRIIS